MGALSFSTVSLSMCISSPTPRPVNLWLFERIAGIYSFLFPLSKPHYLRSHVCLASNYSSDFEREESRWLREEQRWLREEQRWLRQEARWNCEREFIFREISELRLKIEELESRNSTTSASETLTKIVSLLQVLKVSGLDSSTELQSNRIADAGHSARPIVLEDNSVGQSMASEKRRDVERENLVKRKTLRKGSEGREVRAMQEALLKLGFYSGQEDMEYSSFSSGTERAVKTWQASLRFPEDGIMTVELLERLYAVGQIEISPGDVNRIDTSLKQDEADGALAASAMEIAEVHHEVVNNRPKTGVEISKQRVFLLGENRWEEPFRLIGNGNQTGRIEAGNSPTKCLACHGGGRVMCTECDGTGEPNIEPQFLEWVGEEAKCPYCEGLGHIICDLCQGKTVK
ncbi:hypothetical protein Nepgr_015251 [Nepenthes gracilis]|uniref:Peptidoglycan binding-like domain-containing protein n=1 Tax=Nepenthes gracilis TaxID=150966 RepID=A0AAD3XRB6_NEPGR|nr:hypothetical protein Nepgr_015251 [Nepenthes gracilis]